MRKKIFTLLILVTATMGLSQALSPPMAGTSVLLAVQATLDFKARQPLLQQEDPDWQLRVYPNPVKEVLFIRYEIREQAEVNLEIRDLTGKKVREEKLEMLNGESETSVNLSDLNKGIYFLKFYSTERKFLRILKIQKV